MVGLGPSNQPNAKSGLTRSPGLTRVTPSATATTSPAAQESGMYSGVFAPGTFPPM